MPYWEALDVTRYPCPNCGGVVEYEPSCAGYPGGYRNSAGEWVSSVMVCNPWWACGGADEFHCTDRDDCGWWYREPNNRTDHEWNSHQKKRIYNGPQPAWFKAWYAEWHKPLDSDLEPEDYEITGGKLDGDDEPFDDTQEY